MYNSSMHHAKFSILKKYRLLDGNLLVIFDVIDFGWWVEEITRFRLQLVYAHFFILMYKIKRSSSEQLKLWACFNFDILSKTIHQFLSSITLRFFLFVLQLINHLLFISTCVRHSLTLINMILNKDNWWQQLWINSETKHSKCWNLSISIQFNCKSSFITRHIFQL